LQRYSVCPHPRRIRASSAGQLKLRERRFALRSLTNDQGSLIITHDEREGLDGWFQKEFPVQGGGFYRFQVKRKISKIACPRQSCLVRISWQDASGKM